MDETENTELERIRWDGVATSPIGKTPFGFFDSDAEFVSFAPRAADWADLKDSVIQLLMLK